MLRFMMPVEASFLQCTAVHVPPYSYLLLCCIIVSSVVHTQVFFGKECASVENEAQTYLCWRLMSCACVGSQ